MPTVDELRGLWRRSLIAWPDGREDTTTRVHWLQGETFYADLRQPSSGFDFSHAGCRGDLTLADCKRLALQEGFSGSFSFDGRWFEWARRVDYQTVSPYSDAGALVWDGDVLVETGRDIPYIEHWHRDAPPQLPTAGFILEDFKTAAAGAFIRVGEMFMFVRDRRIKLPASPSLLEGLQAADIEQARAMVDCEISFGRRGATGMEIQASSLPYKVGRILELHLADDRLTITDLDDTGRVIEREWLILAREGESEAVA